MTTATIYTCPSIRNRGHNFIAILGRAPTQFHTFTSRFDDALIQELLGEAALKLVSAIDPALCSRTRLLKLVMDFHTPAGLLLDKAARNAILDMLHPEEAATLASILGLNGAHDIHDAYAALKSLRLRRGSEREQALFDYFSLPVPQREEVEEAPSIEPIEAGYPLFEHQRVAVQQITQYLKSGTRRALLHMPTGSGKTRTTMNVIAEHLRVHEPTIVIWLAHSQELCAQAAEEFATAWSCLGNRNLHIYRFWGDHDIDVSSINDGFLVAGLAKAFQTAKRQIEFITELGRKTSLVIMDEAHSAVAETFSLLLDGLFMQRQHNTALLGLTATPGRSWLDMDEDERLARFFDKQKVTLSVPGYVSPIDYLVDEGYLAQTEFKQLHYHSKTGLTTADLQEIENSLDIPRSILRRLAEDEQRNLRIYVEIERLAKQHQRILVFATTVKHSDLLAAVLRARGYDARSVTSKASATERKIAIQRYKQQTDDARILCNFGVLTTGFDAPQTSAAVIARPTKSLVLYSQMVGRAIRGRKAGGNDWAEIVTIVDQQLPGFGSVADAFGHWEDIWE